MRCTTPILLAIIAASALASCGPRRADPGLTDRVAAGEFGDARQYHRAFGQTRDRDVLLVRARRLMLALAEGIPEAAARDGEIIYDTLRTQDINRGRDLGTAIRGEQFARHWKGEPFEQAMMLHAVALLDASRGNWDNARAAESQALVLLEDFAEPDHSGQRLPRFEPAYIVRAIAARVLGQQAELDEATAQLESVSPWLAGFADELRTKPFNTVLVVDAGLGPAKTAFGAHGSVEGWSPRFDSDDAPLLIDGAGLAAHAPVATDTNRLADELSWAHFARQRAGKAALGDALIVGGMVVASQADDDEAQLAGWAAVAAGVLMTATAHADTRHLDLLPQRTYVALLDLPEGAHTLRISATGSASGAMTLTAIRPGTQQQPAIIYTRLPSTDAGWAHDGRIYHANDATGPIDSPDPRDQLPYILGGRDVRSPSRAVLADYHAAGLPSSITLDRLRDLYRAEGIIIAEPGGKGTPPARHILESGRALYTPRPGSTGFARLFGREHPPYQPRSERLGALRARMAYERHHQGDHP